MESFILDKMFKLERYIQESYPQSGRFDLLFGVSPHQIHDEIFNISAVFSVNRFDKKNIRVIFV